MERVLSPDEKLRRAEQIYYQRRNSGIQMNRREKTVNVPVSNKKYMYRKMVIQILICLLIYSTYYAVKNFNLIFSNEVIDKTNQILSYDIDVQKLYCQLANYINNYDYFNNKKEITEDNNNAEAETTQEFENEENESEATKVETLSAAIVDEVEISSEESSINQMQQDADDINKNYSLIRPLKGQVTSRFGVREAKTDVVSPYHVGLDIAANTGTAFVAGMAGEVVYSGDLSGYGKCIQIQKDDIITIYGHCNKLYVKKGEKVSQGQKIGEVGATGNVTGPHLHFEIRKSGRYVDPELILKAE